MHYSDRSFATSSLLVRRAQIKKASELSPTRLYFYAFTTADSSTFGTISSDFIVRNPPEIISAR